jgi:hypothetical protein
MAKKPKQQEHEQLTEEELEKTDGEPLPDREAMMVMKPPLPAVDPLPPVYSLDPPVSDA